jgi:hypothetical protein
MKQSLINNDGGVWIVELRESKQLKHIDGFAMTYSNLSCVTISEQLSEVDKERGLEALLSQLRETPIGSKGTIVWSVDEEFACEAVGEASSVLSL